MNLNLTPLFFAWVGLSQDPAPLLNGLFRSALLLAVALGIGYALRGKRPEARVLVYRAALLCTMGIALLGATPSVLPDLSRWSISLYSSPASPSSPAKLEVQAAPGSLDMAPGEHLDAVPPSPKTSQQAPWATPNAIEAATPRDNRIDRAIAFLFSVWPLLSVWLLARLACCHAKIVWMRHRARPIVEPDTLDLLRVACAAIGVKTPRLRCSSKAHGPFLCGIWRPTVILPTDFAAQFDSKALHAIFLHEAAHIRNYDCAWTYARRIACALLWPQPLLWVLSRQMEVASEETCDLAVLEGGCAPRDYARCLVDLAERLCLTRAERTVGAGVLATRSALAHRVEQIMKGAPQTRHLTRGARWGMVGMALCLGAASVAFAIDASTPLGAAGEIHGRVVYEDGKPAAGLGIEVDIHDAEQSRIRRNGSFNLPQRARKMLAQGTTTGADGSYRIKNLLAGAAFNVMVHNGLFATPGEGGPPGFVGAAQVVKPQRDKNIKVKDIVLTRGALIEGRIEDAVSGLPLANMSVGCHGPHRPPSTGFITGARTDNNGRFVLRVPPGKSWVYWNGFGQNMRAEVHLGSSEPYEKELSVVKSGQTIYGMSDFVEVSVDGQARGYTRSGHGGLRPADEIVLQGGQRRRMTFRLTPLRIKYRPGKVPIVKMSDEPPLPGSKPLAWDPNATLPARGTGIITGRAIFPDGKPAGSVGIHVQIQNRALESFPDAPAVYSSRFDKLLPAQKAMLKQNLVTGADGTYRVEGLIDAPYDIAYTRTKGSALANWIAAPLPGITARPNQTVAAPDMKLQHGAIIRGQIYDATTQTGLPQCFLVIEDGRWPPSTSMGELFDADKNGRFSIRVLPGKVQVALNFMNTNLSNVHATRLGGRLYDPPRALISLDGKPQKNGVLTHIALQEGQTRQLDFSLPRSSKPAATKTVTPQKVLPLSGNGVLSGKVVTTAGTPLGGAKLIVRMQEAAIKSFKGIPITSSAAAFAKLPPGQQAMLLQNVITRNDGTYRIQGLAEAPYDILFYPWKEAKGKRIDFGWVAPPLSGIIAQSNQVVTPPKMVATRGALIAGRVLEKATGQPVPEALVIVYDGRRPSSSPGAPIYAEANAGGRYQVRVLPGSPQLGIGFMGQNVRVNNARGIINVNGIRLRIQDLSALTVPVIEGQKRTVDYRLSRVK